MKDLSFEALAQKHVNEALELFLAIYDQELQAVPILPPARDFTGPLKETISSLFERGSGLAALAQGRLVGYMTGLKAEEFFGTSPGMYIPLPGHATAAGMQRELYQALYARAAELWVSQGYTSHALTIFAHDRDSADTWFHLGFGLRCVDALRETEPLARINTDIEIRKLKQEDISPELIALHREHCQYYNQSPIFMPRSADDPDRDIMSWLEQENLHLWAAYLDGRPQGYTRLQPEGETFVSRHPAVMNITSLYVSPKSRTGGVGAALVNAAQLWLREGGWPLCGVDFESINILGSRFWHNHFTPYTYSLTRRIDERARA